jgi:rhamnosyltransferase subunit B
MHALLLTVGTDGDVYPYVAVGARLRARGHRVTLLATEPYRALAADHGLAFGALVSTAETEEAFGNPDFWHPLKGAWVLARWGVRFLPRQYEQVAELARADDAVLVASPGVLVGRLVQETLSRPLASVVLQPWMLPSVVAPQVMPVLSLPRWAPRWVRRCHWWTLDAVGDLLVGRHLNRLRQSLGLPPIRRIFRWWWSPQLVLGLFPDWYGPPQPDWPPQVRLAGFPLDDRHDGPDLAPEVRDWCRAGEPPVAVTFGTGMRHAANLFRATVDACGRLGRRGLLLTRHPGQLPDPLPPFVRHCPFAPFRQLLPHCAAVVHHGGVGTVARALAAATPQLILPITFDQPDNAARVRQLGAGDWLPPRRASGARIAAVLTRLLTPEARLRCQPVAARFGKQDALEVAADCIEELWHPRPQDEGGVPGSSSDSRSLR